MCYILQDYNLTSQNQSRRRGYVPYPHPEKPGWVKYKYDVKKYMKLVESDAQKQQEAMQQIVEASELLWSAKREQQQQERMKEEQMKEEQDIKRALKRMEWDDEDDDKEYSEVRKDVERMTKDTLIVIATNGISQFFLSHLNALH